MCEQLTSHELKWANWNHMVHNAKQRRRKILKVCVWGGKTSPGFSSPPNNRIIVPFTVPIQVEIHNEMSTELKFTIKVHLFFVFF